MQGDCFIFLLLIGLLPDAPTQIFLHPLPSGDDSRQSCKSFRREDAFKAVVERTRLDSDYKFNGKSLVGMSFGRLTVTTYAGVIHYTNPDRVSVYWDCLCVCGKPKLVSGANLKTLHVRSCNCFQTEHRVSHGFGGRKHRHPMYQVWSAMIQRCTNPKCKGYKWYGARGIQVCERWRNFKNFLDDMGVRPAGKTVERTNVNGNYDPNNCVWDSEKVQARNKRNTIKITHNNITLPVVEWAEKADLPYGTLRQRIKSGWSFEDAITTPRRMIKGGI